MNITTIALPDHLNTDTGPLTPGLAALISAVALVVLCVVIVIVVRKKQRKYVIEYGYTPKYSLLNDGVIK